MYIFIYFFPFCIRLFVLFCVLDGRRSVPRYKRHWCRTTTFIIPRVSITLESVCGFCELTLRTTTTTFRVAKICCGCCLCVETEEIGLNLDEIITARNCLADFSHPNKRHTFVLLFSRPFASSCIHIEQALWSLFCYILFAVTKGLDMMMMKLLGDFRIKWDKVRHAIPQ